MSNNKVEHHHIILRRDTLKLCLVPVGAYATRLLGGCSDAKKDDSGMLPSGGGGGSNSVGTGGAASNTTSQPGTGGSSSAGNGVAGMQASTGSGGSAAPITGSGGMQASTGTGGHAPTGNGAQMDAGTDAGAGDVAAPGTPWATGGTKTITGSYPDPFMDDPGTACAVYPTQTIGPCYAQGPMMREDISDGLDGLPIRLSFLVVKSDGCTPVPNASVDIWHSGSAGIYSAYAMGTVCNPGSDDVLSDMFCRGVQTSDDKGRVDFSTVFPGWYTGRTIHIHFTIRIGGQEYVTSQIYFEDALSDEILAQGQYAARGKRDTTNANDMLFTSGGATAEQVLFSTAKRPDGVLHAWKVLSIHS